MTGSRRVDYDRDDVLLSSVVHDGELHMPSFIEHHFRLGMRHIVMLDYGSVDRSVEIASSYPDVTILTTTAR